MRWLSKKSVERVETVGRFLPNFDMIKNAEVVYRDTIWSEWKKIRKDRSTLRAQRGEDPTYDEAEVLDNPNQYNKVVNTDVVDWASEPSTGVVNEIDDSKGKIVNV